jgi:alkylation response protein AidB-like acyl-CoA dehydrogenase
VSLDFELSEEHQLVEKTVRDAMAPWVARRAELRAMTKRAELPEELWKDFAEIGLLGCLIPEEYGGSGLGLLAQSLGFESVTALGLSPNVLLVNCMDAACLAKVGSEDLKQHYLPGIADGSHRFCFAITEADAGSNAFAMKSHAERRGDRFVLNGSKVYISGFDVSQYMLLVARTTKAGDKEGHRGLTLFVVPTDAPGITSQLIPVSFAEGVNQYALYFDDVEIPEDHVVGEVDAGAVAMFLSLNPERILAAAMCSGMAEYCIGAAVEYAKDRKVFRGTPIGSYQGIAHPLAECKIHHEAARMLMLKAGWAFDAGQDAARVGSLANMCKLLNADSALRSADVCIEVHGGNGFTEEYGFLDMYNGARLLKTAPVSREMILNFVSEWDLGLPRSY